MLRGKSHILAALLLAASVLTASAAWWKGNLHTHTYWSDGDDFPEMVTEWYKTNGYHFLALSDHNIVLDGEKWLAARTNATFTNALVKYRQRFGTQVRTRQTNGKLEVRLANLADLRPQFEKPGRFLLIPSEEISAEFEKLPIHINVTNLRDLIQPKGGNSVLEVMQNNIDEVLAQRKRTGQPMIPHLNHPNFHYAIKAEELMLVKGERFFEVYNGHPAVYNEGNTNHPGTDRIWDIVLAWRLGVFQMEPLFGIAVDDSHNYHEIAPGKSNTGRGWIQVNSPELSAASLIHAMEAGDFYASTGVEFLEIKRAGGELSLRIKEEPGVTYKTQFIGTLRSAIKPVDGKQIVQSDQIGQVFAEQNTSTPSYRLKGNELYVRARVLSSKPKKNGVLPTEHEQAWSQPLF